MKRHLLNVAIPMLLAVLALTASGVRPARAQSGNANPSLKAGPAAAQKTAPRDGSRGLTTGIKVHGHWTIETRNPDGKLARHAEFENSLYNQNFLVGLISGIWTWGGISISPRGSSALCSTNPSFGECAIYLPAQKGLLAEPSFQCGTSATVATPQPYCYATLVSSPNYNASTAQFTGLTLSGQAYADSTSSITSVLTAGYYCATGPGTSTVAPSTCISGNTLASATFTTQFLAAPPNCGGQGQSPCQVPVVAGQTIQVTVNYTFQ